MPPVTPDSSPLLATLRNLPAGDRVAGFYLVARCDLKPKRNGGHYFELKLQDGSGTMDAKMWEEFEEISVTARPGMVIKLEGTVDHYRDSRSIVISRIRVATAEEVPDPKAFLPRAPLSATEAMAELEKILGTISNPHFRSLLEAIFADAEFMAVYLASPAGKQWHHAQIGGLAQHTITLTRVADCICQFYPQLNHDLLVTGALLHDIGKVFELSAEAGFDYTTDGRLLGHIFMGAAFVEEKISRLPDFPLEIRRQVLHMILAHQGDGTMGSPVKPMTLESLVVHYLDELDSKIEAFLRVRAATPEGQPFSDYVKLMDRFFYFQSIDERIISPNGGHEHE